MRVKVIKIRQQAGDSGVDKAVVTRVYPLKALQVVDVPDIRVNNKGTKTPSSGQNEATEERGLNNQNEGARD